MEGLSLKFRPLVASAALSHFVYLFHCSRDPSVCAAGPASSVLDFALPETVLRIPLLPLLPVALLPDRACHLLGTPKGILILFTHQNSSTKTSLKLGRVIPPALHHTASK